MPVLPSELLFLIVAGAIVVRLDVERSLSSA